MIKLTRTRCFPLLLALFIPSAALAAGDNGQVDAWFAALNSYLATLLFFDVMPGEGEMPMIVAWLIVGALFLTLRMGFVNLRLMRHAWQVVRGRYSHADDSGEVTHFQALTTALSATVGLGNIAGVAIAISIGGPGATFWMVVAGFLGMTSKFTEVTLAQMYREVRADGHVMGGAMEYLSRGIGGGIGQGLAALFALLTIGASLGAGNAFQVGQALGAVEKQVGFFADNNWAFGVVMAFAVGVVIIGGIQRIAHTAEKIVPLMIFIYLVAALWIIFYNFPLLPDALLLIVHSAFSMEAGIGGLIGTVVQGFKRAAFSSEAGIGSAAIAHSAAKTPYPVRQGIVALYEPFIDTVVICTMTALVIVISGVYDANGEYAALVANREGAALTAAAFGTTIAWFPVILSISVVLFAYSTMISWSYYGERCWTYLFGENYSMVYRILFVVFIVVGSVTSAASILDFSDLLLLSMAFPNFIGLYLLNGKVKAALNDYLDKLRSGEFEREMGR